MLVARHSEDMASNHTRPDSRLQRRTKCRGPSKVPSRAGYQQRDKPSESFQRTGSSKLMCPTARMYECDLVPAAVSRSRPSLLHSLSPWLPHYALLVLFSVEPKFRPPLRFDSQPTPPPCADLFEARPHEMTDATSVVSSAVPLSTPMPVEVLTDAQQRVEAAA